MISHSVRTYKSCFRVFLLLYATKQAFSMQSDVTLCVIYISNNVKYLNKEQSYNSTKEVML